MSKEFHPPDGRSYEVDKENNVIAIDGIKVKPKNESVAPVTSKKKGVN